MRRTSRRRWLFRFLAIGIGLAVGLTCLEIFLNYYPPVALRIRGSRISLPTNSQTVITNDQIAGIDPEITQTRNALGFRGPDPPDDFPSHLTIVAVGGSTTECFYLSDDKTWPTQLAAELAPEFPKLWVNNAGLDGHSTYGHLHLMQQYLTTLQPDVALFLVGLNDVGRSAPRTYDDLRRGSGFLKRAYLHCVDFSATLALIENYRRHRKATNLGIVHTNVDHEQLKLSAQDPQQVSDQQRSHILENHRAQHLEPYRQRLRDLIALARTHDIEPILVTQPALYGTGVDPETQVDLSQVRVGDVNGAVQWEILELYNDVTREVAGEQDVFLIDLAAQLPKNSAFYYDYHHFTNRGAEEVAKRVATELRTFLHDRFSPQHRPRTETAQ